MKQKVVTVTMNPSIDKAVSLSKLVPYELNRVRSMRLDPGGKGINVGSVLRGFGVDVTLTGLIAGHQGETLIDRLRAVGIDSDFLRAAGETRTNLKIIDESNGRITEINEPGFDVTPEQVKSFLDKLEAISGQAGIVVLSGSLPPGVPVDFYAQCTAIAKKNGAKVLLDTEGPALFEGLNAAPYAVKPNLQELGTLLHAEFNGNHQVVEAAKKLIEKGVEIVIVSMGPEGGIFVDRNEVFKADSWDIPVKSTVGAGDAMVAALAYSMLKGDSLYDTARFAIAAGTITVSKIGTQFCSMEEVQGSLWKVFIRDL